MGQQRSVNAQQVEVLNWILDGCPDGVMTGHSYMTTAIALQNRGLVTVSKRGGGWSAVVTEAGRHFATHGDYPPRDKPALPGTGTVAGTVHAASPAAPRPAPEPLLASARQLIADLLAGDGTMTVERSSSGSHETLIKAVHRFGLIPDGKILTIGGTNRYNRQQVIRLADQPVWMTAVLEPIPVAD